MGLKQFTQALQELDSAVQVIDNEDNLNKKALITNFQHQQKEYSKTAVKSAQNMVATRFKTLSYLQSYEENRDVFFRLGRAVEKVLNEPTHKYVQQALDLSTQIHVPERVVIPHIPAEIKNEFMADLEELQRCFDSRCYRSAIILCGRILELTLHWKYYKVTGNDLLEKSPGIGLGNLIARLAEKNITLDPGLSNQVHLINQVRISSVHKKQKPFSPSQTQTRAIMLYTMDVVEKLFT